MEPMLGFNDEDDDVVSHSFKVVPWITWDEWKFVKQSLFSSSPDTVASALQRISTWRSRGCNPVMIDVTASIIEIQQKDPFFRNDLDECGSQSEEMLAMLYCMAIMRLVNGVVEKTRQKNEISIGEAADAIGIPRMLIDIRHEGSHRDLPSLQLVRLASRKALDWLKTYYWEPQEKAIPIPEDQSANIRKEIKRRLREVNLCLKARHTAKSCLSHVYEKRIRKTELLCGHNKFLYLASGKTSTSSSAGSKKQVTKLLKNILRLYSSYSPVVVSLLLEYLLNALDSSILVDHVEDSQKTAYDDWKSVVLKLSSKEPEFLVTLTKAVLEKIETNTNLDTGDHQSQESPSKDREVELLSILFEWLIQNLKTLTQRGDSESKGSMAGKTLEKATQLELLRRCLLVSFPRNKRLMSSALDLAQMTGDTSLLHKLKKLALIGHSNAESNYISSFDETSLSQQEDSIHEAEKKFGLIRSFKQQGKKGKPKNSDIGAKTRWALTKSWNPCPIGMLPHTIGFSGRLPALDCANVLKNPSDNKEHLWELNKCGKRNAEGSIMEMDSTSVKKVKETEPEHVWDGDGDDMSGQGVKGQLMIDGVWKKVGEEELSAIASSVRLLV